MRSHLGFLCPVSPVRRPQFEVTHNLLRCVSRTVLDIQWRLVELVVLILVVVVVLLVLTRGGRFLGHLIVNGIVGVVLLLLTNLVLADDIPINLLTILICAIGGVLGWLIILVLHLLGVAFYVPA
jgi:hypothetical protein